MGLSEFAFTPSKDKDGNELPHPATVDTYTKSDGHEVRRERNIGKIRGELSEIATHRQVGSFERPAQPQPLHDHNPDN